MRVIYTDNLPKDKNNKIIWNKTIGYTITFTYDDLNGELTILDYDSKNRDLYVKYLNREVFAIKTCHLLKCAIGKIIGVFTGEFKINIGENIKDDKRDIIITDKKYIERKKKERKQKIKVYKYTCNKCGWNEGWIEESEIFRGYGCACCSSKKIVQGINDIPTTAPWMVKYFANKEESRQYPKTSGKYINVICPDCGKEDTVRISDLYKTHSIGCFCEDNIPYPQKFMFNFLSQLNVDFETEFSPKWCKYYLDNKLKYGRYDFCFELNNKKYIIETDGEQHKIGMRNISADEQIYIDNQKDSLAKSNNYNLIRIDCSKSTLEYIKNSILQSHLINIFNIFQIDWLKCEEFALNNLSKEICNVRKQNPEMTTKDIGILFNLHYSTIAKYLKKGNLLGWCEYVAKDEVIKNAKKTGKLRGKKVSIYKDNVLLGEFKSCIELSKQSEILYGVKLNEGSISEVCRGRKKTHKGYTFKYIGN